MSTPLGSLVYHLLLLLAVEACLAMAWEEWRRSRRGQAQRLLVGMAGLGLLRLVYVGASLVVMAGWASRVAVLPPLERFVDAASLALFGWALLPPLPSRTPDRALSVALSGGLVLAVAGGIASLILWGQVLATDPAADYNLTWQTIAWSGLQIVLAALAATAAVRNRGEGWVLFFGAMLLILAGRPLQMLYPAGVPHLPTWERLTNLVAYTLLAVAVYQNIVVGLHVRSRQLQDISQASMDQIKSLLFLFEAGREMSSSLDLPAVLDNAVQGIARALDADQCAIAFPQDSDPGQMRLAAIYNPARQGRGEGVAFPLDYQLAVRQAMRRKRYVIVEEADNVQLKVLFALLGSSEIGPLLIQPLLADDEAMGAIIVGNARTKRPFTANEAKLCQSMAEQVAGAIQNARRYRVLQSRGEELARTAAEERRLAQQAKSQVQELADRLAANQATLDDLRRREEAAREARNALEIKLVSSRAESEALAGRIALLESDLAQTHANAEAQLGWHKDELARLEASWQDNSQAQDRAAAVIQGMTAGILIADAEGRIVEANVAAEILLDRDIAELKGLGLPAISDDHRWQEAVATAAADEAVRLTLRLGTNILLCDVAPLSAVEEDRPAGIVVVMQDITAETEEHEGRLNQVAGRVADLRASVGTTLNYANLIAADSTGIVGSKYSVRLRAALERMARAMDQLAHLIGDGAGAEPTGYGVRVGDVVQAAVIESQRRLNNGSLAVDVDLPHDLPAVEVNPDQLQQVVIHLVMNAVLASPAGGRVQVKARRPESRDLDGNGFVVLSVKDCGGGLSSDALDRVFDRARPGQSPPGLGASGAELALVKTIVETIQGRVWVETETGVGTTFMVALPVETKG